jgi:hypothetical protein
MRKERLALEEPIEGRCTLKKGSKKERDRANLLF